MPQMTASTARRCSIRSVSSTAVTDDSLCGLGSRCSPWQGTKPRSPTIVSVPIEPSDFFIAPPAVDHRQSAEVPDSTPPSYEDSVRLLHKRLRHPPDAENNGLTLGAEAR